MNKKILVLLQGRERKQSWYHLGFPPLHRAGTRNVLSYVKRCNGRTQRSLCQSSRYAAPRPCSPNRVVLLSTSRSSLCRIEVGTFLFIACFTIKFSVPHFNQNVKNEFAVWAFLIPPLTERPGWRALHPAPSHHIPQILSQCFQLFAQFYHGEYGFFSYILSFFKCVLTRISKCVTLILAKYSTK